LARAKADSSGIKADELEPGEAQAGRSACVDEREILIAGPQQGRDATGGDDRSIPEI